MIETSTAAPQPFVKSAEAGAQDAGEKKKILKMIKNERM